MIGVGVTLLLILLFYVYDFGKTKGLAKSDRLIENLERQIDSINSLPPVIKSDTVWEYPDPEIKWYPKLIHDKVVVEAGTYLRTDSLVNDELAFWILDSLDGRLRWRTMGYKLFVPKLRTITDSVFEKVPVFIDRPVPTYYDGFWLTGGAGGGSEFAYSLGLGYSKGRSKYGVNYMNFGGTNNWLLSYSYLIYRRK